MKNSVFPSPITGQKSSQSWYSLWYSHLACTNWGSGVWEKETTNKPTRPPTPQPPISHPTMPVIRHMTRPITPPNQPSPCRTILWQTWAGKTQMTQCKESDTRQSENPMCLKTFQFALINWNQVSLIIFFMLYRIILHFTIWHCPSSAQSEKKHKSYFIFILLPFRFQFYLIKYHLTMKQNLKIFIDSKCMRKNTTTNTRIMYISISQ